MIYILSDVNYLLNPFELNINITTENPKIILASNKLEIKKIKTNISLKSLFANNLLINNLKNFQLTKLKLMI